MHGRVWFYKASSTRCELCMLCGQFLVAPLEGLTVSLSRSLRTAGDYMPSALGIYRAGRKILRVSVVVLAPHDPLHCGWWCSRGAKTQGKEMGKGLNTQSACTTDTEPSTTAIETMSPWCHKRSLATAELLSLICRRGPKTGYTRSRRSVEEG